MLNDSQMSESAGSEAAANSTFLEDLEKSLDAESDDTTGTVCLCVSS